MPTPAETLLQQVGEPFRQSPGCRETLPQRCLIPALAPLHPYTPIPLHPFLANDSCVENLVAQQMLETFAFWMDAADRVVGKGR